MRTPPLKYTKSPPVDLATRHAAAERSILLLAVRFSHAFAGEGPMNPSLPPSLSTVVFSARFRREQARPIAANARASLFAIARRRVPFEANLKVRRWFARAASASFAIKSRRDRHSGPFQESERASSLPSPRANLIAAHVGQRRRRCIAVRASGGRTRAWKRNKADMVRG